MKNDAKTALIILSDPNSNSDDANGKLFNALAGEAQIASRNGRLIADKIPKGALKFVDKQPFVLAASLDPVAVCKYRCRSAFRSVRATFSGAKWRRQASLAGLNWNFLDYSPFNV